MRLKGIQTLFFSDLGHYLWSRGQFYQTLKLIYFKIQINFNPIQVKMFKVRLEVQIDVSFLVVW